MYYIGMMSNVDFARNCLSLPFTRVDCKQRYKKRIKKKINGEKEDEKCLSKIEKNSILNSSRDKHTIFK